MAVFNTNAIASTGAIGWVLIDYVKHGRRFSVTGVCEGIIAGLVGITLAAEYVSVWYATAIGFITAIVISLLQNINGWVSIDEGMDVFKLYGMGGSLEAFSRVSLQLRLSRLWMRLHLHLVALTVTAFKLGSNLPRSLASPSFTVSLILCYVLKYVPGMHLRVSDEAETVGLDLDQFFDEQIGDWSLFEHASGIP